MMPPRTLISRLAKSMPCLRAALLAPVLAVLALAAAATPRAHAAEPAPGKNYVGINPWFLNDWDGSNAFVDLMKHARPWQLWENGTLTGHATCDDDGWPEQDCGTVMFHHTNEAGAYTLKFTGQAAAISLVWIHGSVSGVAYDRATNTTTAKVTLDTAPAGSGALVFTGTRRTPAGAAGTGITDVRLYRPGYPTDGSVLFTRPFLDIVKKFQVIRFMDWQFTNQNPIETWAQRRAPFQFAKPDPTIDGRKGSVGHAIEDYIALCNAANADLWLNIPIFADDDYITKAAQLIRYGGDARGIPYTHPVDHPVYPPLHANLKVYVEYGNEIWNFGGGFYDFGWVKSISDQLKPKPRTHPINFDGETDQYVLFARCAAWKTVNCSNLFRAVFGDAAMMTRVRPVLEGQLGGWFNPKELTWLDAFYATARPATDPFPNPNPHPLSYYLYGSGGSGYYGVINAKSPAPDAFLASSNWPDPKFYKAVGRDALWARNYGLKRVAYEGGMGLPSRKFSDAQNRALNADPRMTAVVEAYQDLWSEAGGDLLVYYCVVGPPEWEFTPRVADADTPKLRAIDAIVNSRPRAPVTFGGAAPGVINCETLQKAGQVIGEGDTFPNTIGGAPVLGLSGHAAHRWLAFAVNSAQGADYNLAVSVIAAATCNLTITVNGAPAGSLAVTGQGNTLVTSPALKIHLQAGLNAIRVAPQGASYLGDLTLKSMP